MSTAVEPATRNNPAKELTEEERQQRTDLCFQLEQTIKENIARGREAFWQLSKALYEFDTESGWSALGYETQGEWLAQPEIGMSRRQFFRMVRNYRETVVQRGISMTTVEELEPSKVEIVLPAIESSAATVEEAFEDVRTLGARDLREKYIGAQSAPKRKDDDDDDASGKSSQASANGNGQVDDGASKELVRSLESAAVVDGWLEMGGERRKATRHWHRFTETYPVFQAVLTITAFFDGEEIDGQEVDKEAVKEAWDTLKHGLNLNLSTVGA